jgi:hypothetical protein
MNHNNFNQFFLWIQRFYQKEAICIISQVNYFKNKFAKINLKKAPVKENNSINYPNILKKYQASPSYQSNNLVDRKPLIIQQRKFFQQLKHSVFRQIKVIFLFDKIFHL